MTQRLTTKPDLQNSLFVWTNSLQQIQSIRKAQETIDFRAVQREMDKFVRSFVPLDIDEEDIAHYCNSLISDEEFFDALVRELGQCASGEFVDSIEESSERVMFILLPPPGTLSEGADFEIVRELAFILSRSPPARDGTVTVEWRAEG